MTTPQRRADDEARRVAFHEAGHAVAAVKLGIGFEAVSIVGDKETDGRIIHDAAPTSGVRTKHARETMQKFIVFVLAGPAAEGLPGGHAYDWSGSFDDRDHAAEYASRVTDDVAEMTRLVRSCRVLARILIRQNAEAVHRVAAELLAYKTLSAERVMRIVKDVDRERSKTLMKRVEGIANDVRRTGGAARRQRTPENEGGFRGNIRALPGVVDIRGRCCARA